MILKFKTYSSERGTAWRLLDKIRKIDYEYVDEIVVMAKKAIQNPVIYINNYPDLNNKRVAEVCIVYENGLGDMFYTDDMVYIMNDNGKTCDTINI